MHTLAKPERAGQHKYGQAKQRYQIMLTPDLVDRLDAIADELGITRSEVIERLGRSKCSTAEQLRDGSND